MKDFLIFWTTLQVFFLFLLALEIFLRTSSFFNKYSISNSSSFSFILIRLRVFSKNSVVYFFYISFFYFFHKNIFCFTPKRFCAKKKSNYNNHLTELNICDLHLSNNTWQNYQSNFILHSFAFVIRPELVVGCFSYICEIKRLFHLCGFILYSFVCTIVLNMIVHCFFYMRKTGKLFYS